jgi:hypothetical protein
MSEIRADFKQLQGPQHRKCNGPIAMKGMQEVNTATQYHNQLAI